MKFFLSVSLFLIIFASVIFPPAIAQDKLIGMYVHQHWPYNHPYAARTWTIEDWRGYADGLTKLGYNSVMIWPMLETMPDPLTPSDTAYLKKLKTVIDILHSDFKMKVFLCLCPNVAAKDQQASRSTFERRHFFYSDKRVNPNDEAEMERLINHRETMLTPLKNVDGISIIDSDPGGYPGSTNQQFVDLLVRHRKMFDRIRPGIQLIYWMHAGWEAYGNYYKNGRLVLGSDSEHLDCLKRLAAANPEPWLVANGFAYAKQLGIENKVINFNYGRIEGEPSFPLSSYTPEVAFAGGNLPGPVGQIGNAQTHFIQLPNTFAFVRAAQNRPITERDWRKFASDLLPQHSDAILRAWRTLPSTDYAIQLQSANELHGLLRSDLKPGPLGGLLFGSPSRFISDLELMLRYSSALNRFADASEKNMPIGGPLTDFVNAAKAWQKVHGYENAWYLGRAQAAVAKLNHPDVNRCLARHGYEISDADPRPQDSNFQRIADNLAWTESYTVRMLKALEKAASEINASK